MAENRPGHAHVLKIAATDLPISIHGLHVNFVRLLSLDVNLLIKSKFQDITALQRHLINIQNSLRSNRTNIYLLNIYVVRVMWLWDLK